MYNNQAHKSTKSSPFFLEYSRYPWAGLTLNPDTTSTNLNNVMKAQLEAQEQAKAALTLAAECMKWYYNKGIQLISFKVGNLVLLKMKDYQKTEAGLRSKYNRLFKILE